MGRGTRLAIAAYQQSVGTVPSGYLTSPEISTLMASATGGGSRERPADGSEVLAGETAESAAQPVASAVTMGTVGQTAHFWRTTSNKTTAATIMSIGFKNGMLGVNAVLPGKNLSRYCNYVFAFDPEKPNFTGSLVLEFAFSAQNDSGSMRVARPGGKSNSDCPSTIDFTVAVSVVEDAEQTVLKFEMDGTKYASPIEANYRVGEPQVSPIRADVLGLRLGMSQEDARSRMADAAYEGEEYEGKFSPELEFNQHLAARKPFPFERVKSLCEAVGDSGFGFDDQVYAKFDMSAKKLIFIDRTYAPLPDERVDSLAMIKLIKEKYGEPSSAESDRSFQWSFDRSGNVFHVEEEARPNSSFKRRVVRARDADGNITTNLDTDSCNFEALPGYSYSLPYVIHTKHLMMNCGGIRDGQDSVVPSASFGSMSRNGLFNPLCSGRLSVDVAYDGARVTEARFTLVDFPGGARDTIDKERRHLDQAIGKVLEGLTGEAEAAAKIKL